jgi:hypothetical protein
MAGFQRRKATLENATHGYPKRRLNPIVFLGEYLERHGLPDSI